MFDFAMRFKSRKRIDIAVSGFDSSTIDLASITQTLLVAEHLSFRQAASTLGIRQSAVSRRVRALEDALGVSLFDRHHGGVRVTAAGSQFLEQARRALFQLDSAIKAAGAAGRGISGHLNIGIVSSISAGFLRELIGIFHAEHPDVRLDISEITAREHLLLIQKGRLDVAFVMGRPSMANCDIAEFWSERVFVALPQGHALCAQEEVEWEALRDAHFILRQSNPGPTIQDYVIKRLADLGHQPNMQRFEVGRETSMHLVALGLGVSVTSEATIGNSFPGLEFRPIAGVANLIPFSGVWSPKNDNPAFRRFLSLARVLSKKWANYSRNIMIPVLEGEATQKVIARSLVFVAASVQMFDLLT